MAAKKDNKSSKQKENALPKNNIEQTDKTENPEQSKALKLDYFLNEYDFSNSGMRYMYASTNVVIAMVLCVLLLFNVCWQIFVLDVTISTSYLVIIIIAIAIPTVVAPLMIKLQSRKLVDSHVAWEKHQRLNFNAKGMSATGKKTGYRYKWEELRHVKEDKKYFYFCTNNAIKYILPKTKISTDETKMIRKFIKNSPRKKRTHLLDD